MASTSTSPPATVKGITYKTEVIPTSDGGLKTITSKSSTPNGTFIPITSTIVDKTGKASKPTFESGANDRDKAAFSNPTSEESKSRSAQIESTKPFGNNPTAEKQKLINAAKGNPNKAITSPNADESQKASPLTSEEKSAFNQENKYRSGTREKYDDDLIYPLKLSSELQDVIKFTILKYSPSLTNQNQSSTQFGSSKSRVVTLESGIPIIKGSTSIGNIILPIPAGISDTNSVSWNNDTLNDLQAEFSKVALGFFDNGVDGAGAAIDNTLSKAKGAEGDLGTLVKSTFTKIATQGANVAGRAFGVVSNNNLELLFSGPSLRSFNFTFSFYPRGEDEAIRVRKIIRTFKQSMSVKRSDTSLLLKAPHTFAISYITGKKAQPYLNRFKECALVSCSVDYTPDGTYMTYGGKENSMTAYRLSLQFQELEPIFDDEYGLDYDNIGF